MSLPLREAEAGRGRRGASSSEERLVNDESEDTPQLSSKTARVRDAGARFRCGIEVDGETLIDDLRLGGTATKSNISCFCLLTTGRLPVLLLDGGIKSGIFSSEGDVFRLLEGIYRNVKRGCPL